MPARPAAPGATSSLAAREQATAWDLRLAWATRREVALTVDNGVRLRCRVEHVSPTSAFALVWDGSRTVHVPIARVLGAHRPHFHEDWGPPVAEPPRPRALELPPVHPGQLALAVGDGRPEWWPTALPERRS